MGKSIRSKTKRSWRRAKRETSSAFAAVHSARLQRLSAKLAAIKNANGETLHEIQSGETQEGEEIDDSAIELEDPLESTDAMKLDGGAATEDKRISTHGPRNSRRDEWRASKGLPPRRKSTKLNKQGVVAAAYRSGRSKRRR